MSEDPNNAQARAADACDTAVHDGAAVDLAAVFTALPGIDLVLAPDAPRYTMLAATDGRLAATMTTRAGTLGRPLFDVFPDANPDNDAPTGVGNLQASLDTVLRTCAPHRMAMQRYDLQRPDGTWEERYWAPLNVPVLGPDGAVRYLVHRVDDVTDAVRLAAERDRLRGAVAGSERARASAEATRDAVTIANEQLHEQALELALANRQLQEQADELAASEMRFRAVEDASPDAVVLLRPVHDAGRITDFDFVYGNPVAGRMLGGGTLDGLVGRRMLDVFPNSEAEGYFGAYGRVFATGVPYTREDRYTRDGLDVGVRVTAVRAGDLLHLRHEDIAARLHAEAERARLVADLQAERARLADIVRLAPTFTGVLRGPDHIIDLTNAGFDALVGGRDVQGRTVVDALPETAAQGFVTLLDGVLATGTPFAGREVPYQRPGADGAAEVRYIDFVCQALADADGTRSGVFVHGVDVTDQVRARQEVERLLAASERARAEAEAARAEAQAANQAKSEFLATMSHELRTPLNAIGGYAQLIDLGLAGPVTPQQRDYLTRLTASGQHLLGLVNDVLDLAKVDAGELRVARDRATTDEAVAAALDLVEPQGTTRGVGLVDGTPGARVTYAGDAHRVRQVLVNLLSNAVKFTEAGGTVTVTCGLVAAAPPAARVSGGGPWASVCVADTGIGIVPAEQAAVFEPFHQVEQGRTRTRGGTGLGLAISRRLARLMGGDLTLESRPGVGSAFTLWLPAAGGAGERDNEVVETSAARVMRAAPGVVRGLGALGTLLRRQVDEVVETYAERLRVEPGAPLARGMRQAELEDHLVTALADLAQSLVIVGEAGTAETGLLADSVAINTAVAERHGARRFAQGWDVTALRHDYAVLREVLARAVRADARASGAHAGGADAEAALAILLGFVEQSEARGVTAWQAAHAAAEGEM